MSDTRLVILGGGPTGLGAATRLLEHGCSDFTVLERGTTFGGLSMSVTDAGFTWDLGCHVLHSHYAHVDRVLDRALGPEGWIEHERVAQVLVGDRLVPYPFQHNVHRLAPPDAARCLDGLLEVERPAQGRPAPPDHFAHWSRRTFGDGIHELFLAPYNRKVWACPLEALGWRWVGERVATPDTDQLARCLREGRDPPAWGPNATFRYPASGGAGAPWRALARALPASVTRPGSEVVAVDLPAHRLTLADGETLSYEHLISAAPLDELARMTGRADLRRAARELVHTQVTVIGLGLTGSPSPRLEATSWLYVPDPSVPFHRVSLPGRFSPANVPDPARYGSLLFEVSHAPHARPDVDEVVAATVDGAARLGLIDGADQVCRVWSRHLRRGYPTPTVARDRALAVLQPALAAHHVWSRGRFGAWRYEIANQDHAFMQGVEVVDRILGVTSGAEAEPTLAGRVTRGEPPAPEAALEGSEAR